jgi:beta-xylosidase
MEEHSTETLWTSDRGDGTYTNPIVFADFSDPDVIRVGDTYYMTASSFNYTPGLPILISRDLVNWRLVNYALENLPGERFRVPRPSEGVWAPSIRYEKGWFRIYYGMPDEGIYMVRTQDPLGKWEEPVCVLPGKGLIDPCPYRAADGRNYIVHGYAKSRIGFKSHLGLFEMNADGTKAISEDHILYDGLATQPTIEGPKVYERGGYIYILAPAGGVKTGWQTALRSRDIHGPFEEKIVMQQKDSPINGPHQGGLVDTPEGASYFLHFQDRGLYGRILHLQPVQWLEDWPVMGENVQDLCGQPVMSGRIPGRQAADGSAADGTGPATGEGNGTGGAFSERTAELRGVLTASDDFAGEALSLQWQWTGNHRDDFYSLTEREGALRLFAQNPSGEERAPLWRQSNVLTQKLLCPYLRATVHMDPSGLRTQERAGMIMMGGKYAYLAVRRSGEGFEILLAEAFEDADGQIREREKVLAQLPGTVTDVIFGMELADTEQEALPYGYGKPAFGMFYQLPGQPVMPVETEFFPSDHTWVGAKPGIFACSEAADAEGSCGYADFRAYTVRRI